MISFPIRKLECVQWIKENAARANNLQRMCDVIYSRQFSTNIRHQFDKLSHKEQISISTHVKLLGSDFVCLPHIWKCLKYNVWKELKDWVKGSGKMALLRASIIVRILSARCNYKYCRKIIIFVQTPPLGLIMFKWD